MEKKILWTASELAEAVKGEWVSQPPSSLSMTGVCYFYDRAKSGDLVFAINPKSWGNSYACEVIPLHKFAEAGVAAVIADKDLLTDELPQNLPIYKVENTRKALNELGTAARSRLHGKVICITGSVGKSSTKEGLCHALSQQAETKGTWGNYNHGPGVPLSLAQTHPDTRYGVYEFAVDIPSVTLVKAKIARPHVAIVTDIQPDHLLYYPTLEAIADQKSLLFDALMPGGVVVLNRGAPQFERLKSNAAQRGITQLLTFGEGDGSDVQLMKYELQESVSYVSALVNGKKIDYVVGVPGKHMVINSLAILAGVEAVGADTMKAAMSLAGLRALPNHTIRHKIKVDNGTFEIIDDTFSANSASVQAALEFTQIIKPGIGGRRLAVLGEIQELGEMSRKVHADLAIPVLSSGVDKIITIGDGMLSLREALPSDKLGIHAKTFGELVDALVKEVKVGDVVLIKGSRHAIDEMGNIVQTLGRAIAESK